MREILRDHFNELLLALLLLVMTMVAVVILSKEGWNASDGFKWAAELVSGLLGALLALLMKTPPNKEIKS